MMIFKSMQRSKQRHSSPLGKSGFCFFSSFISSSGGKTYFQFKIDMPISPNEQFDILYFIFLCCMEKKSFSVFLFSLCVASDQLNTRDSGRGSSEFNDRHSDISGERLKKLSSEMNQNQFGKHKI